MTDIRSRLVSAPEAVSDALSQDIYSMKFEPGSKITETDLAERYCVSRNTVREAIARLLTCGILVKIANRGIYVKKMEHDDVVEIFRLRKMFELEAIARLSEMQYVPPQLVNVARELGSIDLVNGWTHYVTVNMRFHSTLVDSVGSRRLSRLYATIASEVKLCVAQSRYIVNRQPENVDDHKPIMDALEREDGAEAARLLAEHLDNAVANLECAFAAEVRRAQK